MDNRWDNLPGTIVCKRRGKMGRSEQPDHQIRKVKQPSNIRTAQINTTDHSPHNVLSDPFNNGNPTISSTQLLMFHMLLPSDEEPFTSYKKMIYEEQGDDIMDTPQLGGMETGDQEGEILAGMEHLSKTQRRKRLRYLRIADTRRLHRKEKKKEAQQRKRERTRQLECLTKELPGAAGDDSTEYQPQECAALPASAGAGQGHVSKLEHQKHIRRKLETAVKKGLRVVLDMSFGEKMTQKEASRLAGQVGRVHGANKLSARPFHMYLTSLVQDGTLHRECVRRNDGFQNFIGVRSLVLL
uniref:tRNA (guanine(9)-N(1))-methyltransferase n=1 Tax=Branchiostoma floridae TaxID=7739 RepID=C3Z4U1_BRAFL|eukprot:XP_002596286.1 hypothetical protein BRAFLDRAFT_82121 [Branchiostoma floridae]